MKTRKNIYPKIFLLIGLIFITANSCERDLSDEVEFATFSKTGEIFTDNFEGGLDYFPFGGSLAEAFSVDTDVKYLGSASMRFDIPQFGIGYGGATFPSLAPRDLSGYDALTFWAKASQGADINEIGFGINGDTNNKFQVTMQNMPISTIWTKYVIAIPDASRLNQEKGMFWYAEGAETSTDEGGYTFWIDELRFEKLGNIAQPQPKILNGVDQTQIAIVGAPVGLTGFSQTFNLGSGVNQTVSIAPSYFTFSSSNTDVAQVSELGVVNTISEGTAIITAMLDGVSAQGSLTVNVTEFQFAPTPTLPAANVISIFSDVYTNVPVDFYNGFYAPFQTTTSEDFAVNGDNILNYQNYNFVGIEFNQNVPTIDATNMTNLHLNIFIPEALPSGSDLRVNLVDFGADQSFGGGDDSSVSSTISASSIPALVSGAWITVDFDITGLANRNNLGQIILDASTDTGPRPSSLYVDNIYLHN